MQASLLGFFYCPCCLLYRLRWKRRMQTLSSIPRLLCGKLRHVRSRGAIPTPPVVPMGELETIRIFLNGWNLTEIFHSISSSELYSLNRGSNSLIRPRSSEYTSGLAN